MQRVLRSIRSTPLRLTAILVTIFILSSVVSFATAYFVIRATFDSTLEDEINQRVATYQAIDDQNDLIERLKDDAETSKPELLILQYLPDQGSPISNVRHFPPISGRAIIAERAIDHRGRDIAESYLARSMRVGRGQLIVAQTRNQVFEMGEIMVSVVLIGLIPTLLFAAVSGAVVARNARRKIGKIQTTLAELTSGAMEARVPINASETDDLSDISKSVNAMASSQEALIASMRQVSADIAHDLKTPIQRVAVIIEQIADKTKLSDGQEDLLDRARAETDRIVKTFQALLQLAQIEGGAVRDRLVSTDLRAVAIDVFEFLEAEAEEQGHGLHLQIEGEGQFIVRGDRHLLSQVVANLIQNGLRHTAVGSQIKVVLKKTDKGIGLTVSDNGAGIPEAEREHVLRRLYRMEKSRTTDGNGLGLSLVAAICALHGAELALSDNAPGLVVSITFPKTDPR